MNDSVILVLFRLGEREDYENQINYYKKMKWNWHNNMAVTPVAFNVDHEEKLGHAKMILENGCVYLI